MRALVFRGPWDIAVEERPDPEFGAGDVLVEIVATGICGSDLHGYTGENGRRFPGQVMGHETVGRIRDLGDRAGAQLSETGTPSAPGTLVTIEPVLACGSCQACRSGNDHRCAKRRIIGVEPSISSAFADLMAVPAANVVALPDSMPAEYGALVEPLAVGRHAAVRGKCGPGDAVFVVGGGPIGQASALAARRLGADSVVVSEPDARRRALLEDIGLPAVDPTAGRPIAEAVSEVLGRPATLALDAVGSGRSLADALQATDMGASVVLVGMQEPQVSLQAYAISIEERSIVGSYCYPAQDFRDTAEWVATAPAELGRLIEGRVGWDGAPDAFRALAKGENPASKVLVFPQG
jgi:threonine dehydrogenase-like Zn-dependent dehydrogenase